MDKTKETAENVPVIPKDVKYDVFISYSRRDYLGENKKPRKDSVVWKLLRYLEDKGVRYWIDDDIISVGEKFPEKIAEAIDESKMMIFVSSKFSNNGESEWIPREINDASRHHLMIIPFRLDSTPYDNSIRLFFTDVNDGIDYYSDPEGSLSSLMLSIEKGKISYYKRKEQQRADSERMELDKQRNSTKVEIAQKVKVYSDIVNDQLKSLFNEIVDLHLDIGENSKRCPVCGDAVPVEYLFCKQCGWGFILPFDTSEGQRRIISGNREQICLMRDLWQKNRSVTDVMKENSCLKESVKLLEDQNSTLKETVEFQRKKISELEERRESVRKPSTVVAFHNGHEYVDLGLPSGLLWATCNVGAYKASGYGSYYAWGETKPKRRYEWGNLAFRTKGNTYDDMKFSKYVLDKKNGKPDGKDELEICDDAAYVNWGGAWRMPTKGEWCELNDNCSSDWVTEEGVAGRRFTSRKNGSSIFLPAAGYKLDYLYGKESGDYLSSSLCTDCACDVFGCKFISDGVDPSRRIRRVCGITIRPVLSLSSLQNRRQL